MDPLMHAICHNGCTAHLSCDDAAAFLSKQPEQSIDLMITSPPYCIGKEYDRSTLTTHFEREIGDVLEALFPRLKEGASMCWQVGYHIDSGVITPLDYLVMKAVSDFPELKLRNRIIWTFGHGMHAQRRFSGRHETVLWFSKNEPRCLLASICASKFDADLTAIRSRPATSSKVKA